MAALACDHLQARLFRCGDILDEYFGLHRPHVWKERTLSQLDTQRSNRSGRLTSDTHRLHISIIDKRASGFSI